MAPPHGPLGLGQPKTASEQVLVVAASLAWPIYQKCSAYVCQANRSFRPMSHLAFYSDGGIEVLVPRILGTIESVLLTREGIQGDASLSPVDKTKLLQLISDLETCVEQYHLGKAQKVFFLSDGASAETIHLPHRILNDKTDKNGKPAAFTMGQRYISTAELMRFPAKTSAFE